MKLPTLEEIHGAPTTWIPISARNPSKLTAHKFVDGKWLPLSNCRFVAWPEKFPVMVEATA
jgi:hypothetical protein